MLCRNGIYRKERLNNRKYHPSLGISKIIIMPSERNENENNEISGEAKPRERVRRWRMYVIGFHF